VPTYRDRGVVLRTVKLGEADRIVTLLTEERGKVRAVAKGVRKTGSKIGARLDPTSHVALQCYEGRNLDTVTQVETIDAFRNVREHYGCLTHAIAMLEAVDQVTLEGEPNPIVYKMLVGALRTLDETPNPLVAAAFFWRLLSVEGFQPVLDACVRCSAPGPFPAFDPGEGGAVCSSCAQFSGRRVEPAVLDLLGLIVTGEVRRALAAEPGPVADEVERLAVMTWEHHLERRLRSSALL
jgi:DNA repair protein RecO (recombination protein O)